MPVASTERIVSTEKYPDRGIILSYDDDDYFQGYGQIKEAFRALTKNDILQPNNTDDDFLSSNVRVDNFGYNLYVLDIQYLPIFSTSQPFNVEFKFDGIVAKDINGYALVLTNKLVSASSDGHFELIFVQGFRNCFIFSQC